MSNHTVKINQLVARTLMATLGLFISVQVFSHSTFAQDQHQMLSQPAGHQPGYQAAPTAQAQANREAAPSALPAQPAPSYRNGPPGYGPPSGSHQKHQPMVLRLMDNNLTARQMIASHLSITTTDFCRLSSPHLCRRDDSAGSEGENHHHHGGGMGLFGFPHFRHFVNRQVPYLPAFLLLLATSCLLWTLLPDKMDTGVVCTREQFWKSLALGILTMGIGMPIIHCLCWSGVGMPLASCTRHPATGFGIRFCRRGGCCRRAIINRFNGNKFFANHPLEMRYLSILIGVAFISLLFLVPNIGILARLGNRLVMLNAVLGLGSLVNARISNKKPT